MATLLIPRAVADDRVVVARATEAVDIRDLDCILATRRRPPVAPWIASSVAACAIGLLLQAIAGAGSRHDAPWAVPLFWFSLLVMFIPSAIVVLSPSSTRKERIVASCVLAVGLALSRIVLYPAGFVYHDELMHLNTLRLITDKHRLFVDNSNLPVSSYYPGLELLTDGVRSITGLTAHTSGVLVLLAARMLITLSLIAMFEFVTGSNRAACIGALVYATNPQYLWFNAQFSYQSLALPLAVAAVMAIVTRPRDRGLRATVPALALAAAVIVSHHLTSLACAAMLLVLWLVERLRRGRTSDTRAYGVAAVATTAGVAAWTVIPGHVVTAYLSSIAVNSYNQLAALVGGTSRHQLFADYSGYATPLWERALSILSVLLILVLLLPALVQGRRWWSARTAPAIALLATAAIYPFIPAGHLTEATSEVTDRSSGFIFVGVGFALGWWTVRYVRHKSPLPALLVACVLFIGGTIVGSGPQWLRMPGPYLVEADNRTVDGPNLAAARWAAVDMPDGGRIFSDRINRLLMAAIGHQYSVTHVGDGIDESSVVFDRTFTSKDSSLLRAGDIQFIVIDERLAAGLPRVGVYMEQGEPDSYRHRTPLALVALRKFDSLRGAKRIYDNGSVAIYDVRGLDVQT